MNNCHINLRNLGFAILAPVCMILVQNSTYAIAIVLYRNNRDGVISSSLLSYMAIILVSVIVYIVYPWIYSGSADQNITAHKNRRKINITSFLRGFIVAVLLCAAGISLQLFSTGILELIDLHNPELLRSYRDMTSSSFSPDNGILRVFTVMFLAPIGEELIFRGITLHSMQRAFSFKYSTAAAVILSALFFGIFHGNVVQFCYAFPAGILLAALTEWSSSLLPGMFLHIVINTSGYLVESFSKLLPFSCTSVSFVTGAGVICALCISLTYMLLTHTYSHKIS